MQNTSLTADQSDEIHPAARSDSYGHADFTRSGDPIFTFGQSCSPRWSSPPRLRCRQRPQITPISFNGTTNGKVKPGSVSKVDIHTLLYAGVTTKVFAHYMPWWGGTGHPSIGLGDEANPAVASAQMADAIGRGIDGFIVDWYGPQNTHHNTATMNIKAAAEASPNFEFAICKDSGSLKGASNPTAKLLSDIQYMADNYFRETLIKLSAFHSYSG